MTLTARHTLLIDAAVSTATGLLMLAGRNLLYPYFGLTSPLLLDVTAIGFIAYAAIVAMAARTDEVSRVALLSTAAANVVYALASAAVLIVFWSDLLPIGRILIVAAAITVEVFATLQFSAARSAAQPAAALPSR